MEFGMGREHHAINDGIKLAARAFAATPRARIVTGTAKLAVVHETQNYSTSTSYGAGLCNVENGLVKQSTTERHGIRS